MAGWGLQGNGDGQSVTLLKVSKSRMQILKFSFEPKNKGKYFCIFALASKVGQIKKMIAHYHAN